MTLGEFKAWLEGYEEGFGGAPNAEQWAKIKEKMGTVYQLSSPVYVPTYVPSTTIWSPSYPYPLTTCETATVTAQTDCLSHNGAVQ